MPLTAWLMFVFGCVVLYGGLAWCIAIAWRKNRHGKTSPDDSENV